VRRCGNRQSNFTPGTVNHSKSQIPTKRIISGLPASLLTRLQQGNQNTRKPRVMRNERNATRVVVSNNFAKGNNNWRFLDPWHFGKHVRAQSYHIKQFPLAIRGSF